MALNPFFLHGSASEQRLVQDLINEQLRMYGMEVYYIPRKIVNRKSIIEEVQSSAFDDSYIIEAYLNTYDGHTGGGDVLSKFGMNLKDEISLVISQERYEEFIGAFLQDEDPYEIEVALRPREGDIVYFPLSGRLFEVKFVEHEKPFYQLGKGYVYELSCELFEYENEDIYTSVPEIDESIQNVGELISLKLVGYGNTSYLGSNINSGYVRKIYLNNDGNGYTSTPTVTFSPAPSYGRTARGVAITTSVGDARSIKEIVMIDAGYGYREAPTITISGGGGVGASATCSLELYRKGFTRASIIDRGEGYTSPPIVTFSGPTYTGAAGTAVISNNALDRVVITEGGTNFSPKAQVAVTFSAPNPAGLQTGIISATVSNAKLSTLSISNPGIGYSQAPILTISAPTGIGSTALITAVGGSVYGEKVSSISIASSGRYYLSNPSLTFSNPTGIASTATANATLTTSGGISTFTYSLTSSGRYYLAPPTLTIDFLSLSRGYAADSKYGSYSWNLINAVPDRNVSRPSVSSVTSIGYSGSVQLFAKVPSSLSGLTTFIELNKQSNGGLAKNVDLRITDLGYFEVQIGLGSGITLTNTSVNALDDTWHYLHLQSNFTSGTQKFDFYVDGGSAESIFLPAAAAELQMVTNAHITPPILKNSLNSGIRVDDIFGTVDAIGSGSTTPPGSTPTANSNTVIFDNFESDAIGSLNSISIGCSVVNGYVTSLDNNSTTLSGIITSIVSAVIDTPTGVPSNFVATGVATITNGVVSSAAITYAGAGYLSAPTVTVSNPTGVATNFTAAATASINNYGKISSVAITNPGLGYDTTPTISVTAPLGQIPQGYANVSVAGTVYSVTLTKAGIGYTEPPVVSIANTVTDRDFATGFATARGRIVLNNVNNSIDYLLIEDPGSGYLTPPTVTIGNPPVISGFGTFWYNEIVLGSTSGTTAIVRRWDELEGVLQVSIENGSFLPGETIVGGSSSAIYVVDNYINKRDVDKEASVQNLDDYEQNDDIEFEADQILDFSEGNPFGNY